MPDNIEGGGRQNPENSAAKNKEKNPEVEVIVAELVELLSMAQPTKFSKTWIKLNAEPELSKKINSLIARRVVADLNELICFLPWEWRKRWAVHKITAEMAPESVPAKTAADKSTPASEWPRPYREKELPTPEKCAKELEALLEIKNPDTFDALWIYRADFTLYKKIRRHFHKYDEMEKGYRPDWELIVKNLPQKWQERWLATSPSGKKPKN